MKRPLNIAECKRIQLELLDTVVLFCKQNRLRFSLAYGSLIGAVRHQGYIPWDDDIDLLMPRPDYDMFIETFHTKTEEVLDLEKTDACVETFAKVCRKGTSMVDRKLGRALWGVNIDIFPIDGVSEKGFDNEYAALERMRASISHLCPYYKAVSKDRLFWFLKYCLKRIVFFKPDSFLRLKRTVGSRMRKVPFETAQKAGAFFGDAGKDEFMDQSVFTQYIDLTFEGRSVPCLARYDEYLTKLFGAYMQLPPADQRVSRHDYDCFIFE